MKQKKIIPRIFRFFLLTILFIGAVPFAVILYFYLSAPIYRFKEPQPFSGEQLYNPYQNMNPEHWQRCNFHVHSRSWLQFTDGRENNEKLIDSIYYNVFEYDHVSISDYQRINPHKQNKATYIPNYEHGYGISKIHQLSLGARKVLWRDYPFFQTLNMKQHIIDCLKKNCDLVVLAHPLFRNGYKIDEMKYLSGYQGIEVLNNVRESFDHWDMALSNGHRVYIFGNDDAHNVLNIKEVGRRFTMVNAVDTKRETRLEALEKGNAFGMEIYRYDDHSFEWKADRLRETPTLLLAQLESDTFTVKASIPADSIRFIGQNGEILFSKKKVQQLSYVIKPTDPYVRAELIFPLQTKMFLNPVTRHNDQNFERQRTSEINWGLTYVLRSIYVFIIAIAIILLYNKHKKKKRKR